MRIDTSDLERALVKFEEETPKEIERRVQYLLFDGARRVTFYMPVDTGRARGGTLVTLNYWSEIDPERLDKSGGETLADAQQMALQFKLGDVGYILNNVFYVPYLEDGTDRMAPVKMFARAFAELVESLR